MNHLERLPGGRQLPSSSRTKTTGVAGQELLVVDEVAPAGGEQVPARGAPVDVAERRLDAVHVHGGDELHGRIPSKL